MPGVMRNVRVPKFRWERAMFAAKRRGETVSDVVNSKLEDYGRRYAADYVPPTDGVAAVAGEVGAIASEDAD